LIDAKLNANEQMANKRRKRRTRKISVKSFNVRCCTCKKNNAE